MGNHIWYINTMFPLKRFESAPFHSCTVSMETLYRFMSNSFDSCSVSCCFHCNDKGGLLLWCIMTNPGEGQLSFPFSHRFMCFHLKNISFHNSETEQEWNGAKVYQFEERCVATLLRCENGNDIVRTQWKQTPYPVHFCNGACYRCRISLQWKHSINWYD